MADNTVTSEKNSSPSVWVFPILLSVIVAVSIYESLGSAPASRKTNTLILVGIIVIPAVTAHYLFDKPTASEKKGVLVTFVLGAIGLFFVDLARIGPELFFVIGVFFIPTIIRILSRAVSTGDSGDT